MVRIPKTERILDLLNRYGLPRTDYPDDEIKLNRDIKRVCRLVGLKNEILGDISKSIKINGRHVRRDVRDLYPKYKLITTRTFRRSFATNYYGEIDIVTIMGVTGHTTPKMLREYLNLEDDGKVDQAITQIDDFHSRRNKLAKTIMKLAK
jgi:integrase